MLPLQRLSQSFVALGARKRGRAFNALQRPFSPFQGVPFPIEAVVVAREPDNIKMVLGNDDEVGFAYMFWTQRWIQYVNKNTTVS